VLFLRRLYSFRFIRFITIGAFNALEMLVLVNTFATLLEIYAGIALLLINTAAFFAVVVMSYFLNKHWTFEHTAPRTAKEFITFAVITLIGLGIQNTALYWLTTSLGPQFGVGVYFWLLISSAAAIIISSFWNFFCYAFVVFKKSDSNTPPSS